MSACGTPGSGRTCSRDLAGTAEGYAEIGVGVPLRRSRRDGAGWTDKRGPVNVANILEDAKEIDYWVRLHRNDLPILWHGSGREYNPDFIAVEVKMNKEVPTADIRGKREAAIRWAQHVNADLKVSDSWRYLLVSEDHVKTAKGSWTALRQLGE